MMRRTRLQSFAAGMAFVLATGCFAQEPIDNCSSLLGSLSVELRYARNLSPSVRTTFVCPRDTRALLGATKQRIVNSLGPPDVTTPGSEGGAAAWSYYFGPKPGGSYPSGVPELKFEFDEGLAVSKISCQRTR